MLGCSCISNDKMFHIVTTCRYCTGSFFLVLFFINLGTPGFTHFRCIPLHVLRSVR